MIQAAIKLLGRPRGRQGPRLLLTSGEDGDDHEQEDPDDQAEPDVLQVVDNEG
jgi:hypothetical protein